VRIGFFDDFRLGVFRDDSVVDVSDLVYPALARYPHLRVEELIGNWAAMRPQLAAADERGVKRPISAVRVRSPLPRPRLILCSIRNYADESGSKEVDFFLKSPGAVVGPGDTVNLRTPNAPGFVHEAELGVVIGATATQVPASRALVVVFGYVPFLDISARGMRRNDVYSWFHGKSTDTFAPIGPWITTADEVADPQELQVRLTVNDELRQNFNTNQMLTRIPELIEVASSITTLRAGDVIATGTHHEGNRELKPGDSMTVEIAHLGRMTLAVT
jgi:2-keto-4-pentenoate hydratase/2-oxohepta-3-ene-1,7-dioic acid hydratase in catechol pathway